MTNSDNTTTRNFKIPLIIVSSILLLAIIAIVFFGFVSKENGKWKISSTPITSKFENLRSENALLSSQVKSYKMELEESMTKHPDSLKGVWFEVQIGAFQQFDLSEYKDERLLIFETKTPEYNKLTLGIFRDYQRATKFKNDMRRIGVKGAWIVARENGNRIEIKQALKK